MQNEPPRILNLSNLSIKGAPNTGFYADFRPGIKNELFDVSCVHDLFKAGLRQPGVSAKFEFRYESLKSKFSFILFAYYSMIGCSKKNRENYRENAFEKKKKKLRLKFNRGLALLGFRTTGPC